MGNSKRFILLTGLALTLLVGGYLRIAGADWGAGEPRDGSGSYSHPDERSVYMKTGGLRWDPVPYLPEEIVKRQNDESWFAFRLRWGKVSLGYHLRAYNQRFLTWESGMNLNSFNYGSFPYYVLFGLSHAANTYSVEQVWQFLINCYLAALVLVVLTWGTSNYIRKRECLSRYETFSPTWSRLGLRLLEATIVLLSLAWAAALVFRWNDGKLAVPAKLLLWALSPFPGELTPGVENTLWLPGKWGLLGRPLSGLCGVLTVLYVYRIGARVYNRRIGLLAAILLAFMVQHIQLCHFFTFDVILAFFTTAALYSLLVFVDANCAGPRLRALLAASIWTGLAMSTKFGGIFLFVPWGVALIFAFLRNRPIDPVLNLRILALTLAIGAGAVGCFLALQGIWDSPARAYFGTVTLFLPLVAGILFIGFKRNPLGTRYRIEALFSLLIWIGAVGGVCFLFYTVFGRMLPAAILAAVFYFWLCFLLGPPGNPRKWTLGIGLLLNLAAVLFTAWAILGVLFWWTASWARDRLPKGLLNPHLANLNGLLQFPVLGVLSWCLIWATTFATQPFGYIDQPKGSTDSTLSFVHLSPTALPKALPEPLKDVVREIGRRLDPLTSPWGFHFGPLMHPDSGRPFPDLVAIGGGRYWKDVDEQRRMATVGGVPWTRQYSNTVPILYQWKNQILYGMGVPLGLLCFFGLFYGFGKPFTVACWKQWLVFIWVAVNFIPTHLFHTKFPRYLAPELPFFALWGAALAVAVYAWLARREQRPGRTGFRWSQAWCSLVILTVVWSALYSQAFLKIYTGEHTWDLCSAWFDQNVPNGKRILTEVWDDAVPWDGRVRSKYDTSRSTNPVHSDAPNHMREIYRNVAWADYYCFSSKRNYGAFLQSETNADARVLFYKSLFSGRLGYRLLKTFSQPVWVLGVPIRFELADESLSLYDHPTVHIFQKVENLDVDEITARVSDPPGWVRDLTYEQIVTAGEDRSILAPRGDFYLLRWLIALFLVGFLFWPLCFVLFSASPDRGWFASKTLGILALTYTTWFGASAGWWVNNRAAATLVFFGWFLVSTVCVMARRESLVRFLRRRWKAVVLGEVLFLLVLAYLLSIKMHNPDIHWGEKPMDTAFLNAAYKTDTFPAQDPWFAGVPINYYYYGQTVVGLFGKWVGVSPDYAYNLAVCTWPALVFALIFGMVYNLTSSRIGAGVGAFLATLAGNGKAFFQLAANIRATGGPLEPKIFRENYVPQDGLPGYLGDAWEQVKNSFWLFDQVFFDKVVPGFQAFLSGYSPESLAAARDCKLQQLIGFDSYFWKLSRICQSSVACEFPLWSALFADLHAHLLVMPFGMLFLSLVVGYCQRKADDWRLRSRGNVRLSEQENGTFLVPLLQILAIGFVFGAVQVTNTWDMPGQAGLLFAALCVLYLGHNREWRGTARWRLWRELSRWEIPGRGIRKIALLKLGFLQEVVLPFMAVLVLSRVLFYPFHSHFQTPERVTGIGWMHEVASGWKTPYEMLQIFGPFLLFLLLGLVMLYWRWSTRSRKGAFQAGGYALLALSVSILATLGMRSLADRAYSPSPDTAIPPKGSLEFWRFLDHDIAYVSGGAILCLLILLVPFWICRRCRIDQQLGALILSLGLAIVVGCEVVFIKEGWGPPSHQWNTVFKLHLQAWLCLGVGCGWLVGMWFSRPDPGAGSIARVIGRVTRYGVGYPVLFCGLLFAGLFPMMAPYLFSQAEGFRGRTRQVEGNVTLDGLAYLRRTEPDVAAAIDWLRTEVEGAPVILEAAGTEYQHETSRFCTFTGLPTLVGWPHHNRERGNQPDPRVLETKTLYTDTNREKVRDLLEKYQVRYVTVGPRERSLYSAAGGKGLRKFDEWTDLFDPAFEAKIESPGVMIYAVHPQYELQSDWQQPEGEPAPSLFTQDQGLPLLGGSEGSTPGKFREPRGLASGPGEDIVVADTFNHRIQAYDAAGRFRWYLGDQGSEPGYFNEPSDVHVDEEGRIAVLDTWNSRVQIFSTTGSLVTVIPGLGGGARGVFTGRLAVSLDQPETLTPPLVVVANTSGRNIAVFDYRGEEVGRWGTSGSPAERVWEPVDVENTPMGLAVADSKTPSLLFFDGRGKFLQSWALPMEPTGEQTNEIHLAWDQAGARLFATDPSHNRVVALDREGKTVFEVGLEGMPTGVEVTESGKVYVTLRSQHRVVLMPAPR